MSLQRRSTARRAATTTTRTRPRAHAVNKVFGVQVLDVLQSAMGGRYSVFRLDIGWEHAFKVSDRSGVDRSGVAGDVDAYAGGPWHLVALSTGSRTEEA